MTGPRLKDLPPPPAGRKGWPWTEESPSLPEKMSDGRPWPRVSVVTPSYDQSDYIEETIRSVLLQGYPELEYIVIDDGSTDGSVEIIKKYEKWLSYWTTRENKGQPASINEGFERSTGDIMAWLNSDDCYCPGILGEIAREIDPRRGRRIVSGFAEKVMFGGQKTGVVFGGKMPAFYHLLFHPQLSRMNRLCRLKVPTWMPAQPSTFWHREVFDDLGPLDAGAGYALDFEYWLRAADKGYRFYKVPRVLSHYRFHKESFSNKGWDAFYPSWREISRRYYKSLSPFGKILNMTLFAASFSFIQLPATLYTIALKQLAKIQGTQNEK
jgi:glycosyltransferase involved in cell wall biosynthesis